MTGPGGVPAHVAALLRDHIDSYEELQVLLLLRSRTGVRWRIRELSERLKLAPELVTAALRSLQAHRLAASDGDDSDPQFEYRPEPPERDAAVAVLSSTYDEQPVEIIKLMCANSIERVRTAALRTFADAFLLRRDSKENDNG